MNAPCRRIIHAICVARVILGVPNHHARNTAISNFWSSKITGFDNTSFAPGSQMRDETRQLTQPVFPSRLGDIVDSDNHQSIQQGCSLKSFIPNKPSNNLRNVCCSHESSTTISNNSEADFNFRVLLRCTSSRVLKFDRQFPIGRLAAGLPCFVLSSIVAPNFLDANSTGNPSMQVFTSWFNKIGFGVPEGRELDAARRIDHHEPIWSHITLVVDFLSYGTDVGVQSFTDFRYVGLDGLGNISLLCFTHVACCTWPEWCFFETCFQPFCCHASQCFTAMSIFGVSLIDCHLWWRQYYFTAISSDCHDFVGTLEASCEHSSFLCLNDNVKLDLNSVRTDASDAIAFAADRPSLHHQLGNTE